MKRYFLMAVAALSVGTAMPVQALSITPSSGVLDTTRWEGDQTGQGGPNGIDAAIASILGSAIELYKQNVGEANDSGSLAGSYTTSFNGDLSGGTITYVPTTNYVGAPSYMLVKDGNNSPAWYLFALSALGWNGTEQLQLSGFWPANGSISHVSLYGTNTTPGGDPPPPPPPVPEPTSLVLLGLGLLGAGVASRRARK